VLKVTLKGGNTYALDFTSAQHGYHTPLSIWSDFLRDRVVKVDSFWPFGTSKVQIEGEATDKMGTFQEGIVLHQQVAATMLYSTVETWLAANKLTFKNLCCLDKTSFAKKRDEFLNAIDNDLRDYNKSVEKEGMVFVRRGLLDSMESHVKSMAGGKVLSST